MAAELKISPEEMALRTQAQKLHNQIHGFESKRRREELQAFVGRCFKYRNSFSSPSKGWWFYSYVRRLHKTDSALIILQFEIDERGNASVSNERCGYESCLQTEITKTELMCAWKHFAKTVGAMKP